MSFLAAFRNRIIEGVSRDPRVVKTGVILMLPCRLVELFEQFNFFQVVRSSGFDAQLSYLAYRRSQEVYWNWHPITTSKFFIYRWDTTEVVALSALSLSTRKRTFQGNFYYGSKRFVSTGNKVLE